MSRVGSYRVALLWVVVAAGCASDDGTKEGTQTNWASCSGDGDCEEGLTCVDERCVDTRGIGLGEGMTCPESIAELCAVEPRVCDIMDDVVGAREAQCDSMRALGDGDLGIVRGCGVVAVEHLGGSVGGSSTPYFDPETGALAGYKEGSDVLYCTGNYGVAIGNTQSCGDRNVDECTLCGKSSCELEACGEEITSCAGACPDLARCSLETGCEGAACGDPSVCSAIGDVAEDDLASAVAGLDALVSCLRGSGCSDACPLSARDAAGL